MPPQKKTGKELLTEGSSQAVGGQVLTIAQTTTKTTHIPPNNPSIEPCLATTETRRPEDLVEQSTTQEEVLANAKPLKSKRTSNKIRKKRLKRSSKMS
jgi:hypothetical protein